jgi:hypothetical protein
MESQREISKPVPLVLLSSPARLAQLETTRLSSVFRVMMFLPAAWNRLAIQRCCSVWLAHSVYLIEGTLPLHMDSTRKLDDGDNIFETAPQ